jgi:N-acyl-phosphatidylethanolamine-hydrolysing phospholipase D
MHLGSVGSFCLRLFVLLAVLHAVPPANALPPADLGPAPRSANGRFENTIGEIGHGSLGIRFGFFGRRIAGSFRSRPGAPARIENDGAFLRENAGHSLPTVTWIGHATLLVQLDHVTFLTDPIWNDSPSPVSFMGPRRFVAPGLTLDELPAIDFILISHNHYDHLDLETLSALARRNPDARFLVPLGNAALLRKNGIDTVEEFDWGQATQQGEVSIYCLPSQHWSKRGISDDLASLWSSWAVVGPERSFFFAGDTGYFDGFARIGAALGPFDLTAVPIGAYEPVEMMKSAHMNPEEAVRASVDLLAKKTVGIHFGTFDLSDEPLDEPPRRFLEAAAASILEPGAAFLLKVGETQPF